MLRQIVVVVGGSDERRKGLAMAVAVVMAMTMTVVTSFAHRSSIGIVGS